MINFTERTQFHMCSEPIDMRKGKESLATIVREVLGYDPRACDKAYIFYSKLYDIVKILHYDYNGYMLVQKWFDDGKMLKPKFATIKKSHRITRDQVMLLLSNAVQTKLYFYDEYD